MQVQAGAPLITTPVTNQTSIAGSTSRRRLFVLMPAVAVPIYVADQVTKAWATANLDSDQPRQLVGSLLQLNLTYNSGAAFSIGTGSTVVLTGIASSVVVFVLIMSRRLGSMGWALALGLLLGGALGNLTDRMLRAPGPGRGHVVDFLQLPNFPVFNIADSAIVSAAVLIALLSFRGISIDGTRAAVAKPRHESAGKSPKQTHAPKHAAAGDDPAAARGPARGEVPAAAPGPATGDGSPTGPGAPAGDGPAADPGPARERDA